MGAILKIDGKKFDFFTSLNINLNHADIASTFGFSAYFDPNSSEHRNLFKPFSYKKCVIETEKGRTVMTGNILSHSFGSSNTTSLTNVSGYSKTGVLSDCVIPESKYPLEKTNLSLLEIAKDLCGAFGISVYLSKDAPAANEKFTKIVAQPSETVANFLIGLAAQKNLVINHDELGNLFIELISTFSTPIAFFEDGQPDVTLNLNCNGQGIHSEITVLKQASIYTNNAGQESYANPYVGSFRPWIKKQSSGTDNNTKDAAKNSVLSEIRNSLKLKITVNRWEWVNNKPELITPNRIISVYSPNNYIFKETKFFVESVNLTSDSSKEIAELTCVVPEIFQGGDLKNIFQ